MTYYALKDKKSLTFSCWAKDKKQFEERVEKAYWTWRGMEPQGSNATKQDFLSDVYKVKITIELAEEKQ